MEPMKNQLWTGKPHNFLGLPLNFTRYFITTDKFITRKGFLNIHEDEVLLYRVTDKKLSLPLTQRIFGCGSITIHAKDSDTPTKELRSIKAPRKVMELLDEVVETARRENLVYGRDMIGALNDGDHDLDGDGDCDLM
ncbi:MAG: PH domain-containing protein [Oscillospiraceae bacterium]|nr:PH domain-containing protein [Oscillospiraceae bacterium]